MTYKCGDVMHGDGWTAYRGDSCEVLKGIPDEGIDFMVYSPPFESIYQYSDNLSCMSNCSTSEEFFDHYKFLLRELHRILVPGRDVSVHVMNLPKTIQRDGVIGIRDFRGEVIRAHEECGFVYHSEVCIWKCPVVAVTRTKALGLLHKQVLKDSAMCRQGIADYVVTFRKPGKNPKPISGPFDKWVGEGVPCDQYHAYAAHLAEFIRGERDDKPNPMSYMGTSISIDIWQKLASPVWMDIRQGRVLSNFRHADSGEEVRHLCPLQLDVIERCLQLWSSEGDIVLSPFMGIGSEGYSSVSMGRKFIGCELKDSYYNVALQNLRIAEDNAKQGLLFDDSQYWDYEEDVEESFA